MRLLDLGCGSGSITNGLAAAVAPGLAVGVDIVRTAVSPLDDAHQPRFVVADACELPFTDASFDAAFAHALLQHVESPPAVLREARRVLQDGGVIGVADADFGSAVLHPACPGLDKASEILRKMRPEPDIGRRLRELLSEAGFSRAQSSTIAYSRGSSNETALDGEFWARYFEAGPFIAHAQSQGWARREEMLEIANAWREWGQTPGAFSASLWCQAVAWV